MNQSHLDDLSLTPRLRAASMHALRLIFFLICLQFFFCAPAQEKIFYLSPSGDDSWSGTLASANKKQTDGPFRTLRRAQAASDSSNLPVTLYLRGGIYPVQQTLFFSEKKKKSIVWAAYQGEEVRLTGGVALTNFQPLQDEKILHRLHANVRHRVVVSDLSALGITRYSDPPLRMNLYYNGKRMQPARYPNQDWLLIADVPQHGQQLFHPGDYKVIKFGLPAGKHYGKFSYEDKRPASWQPNDDIWMHGFWVWDWRDTYQKIEAIDTVRQLIYPAAPHHYYGYEKGQRYHYLNVLEELDAPGEWVLDKQNHLLYFIPPEQIIPNEAILSLLDENMVELHNCSKIMFKNLILECGNRAAIRIQNGDHHLIAGCLIRNFGSDTAVVIHGNDNRIIGCDIHDVGGTAIKISGGDKKLLLPGNNLAENNHIYKYGQIVHMFNTGIWMEGVGNTIRHNEIHNSPGSGIQYYGNDHLIEYNELYDLAHESGDVGGINTGADYSDQGTVIRYNAIHHCHGRGEGGFRAIYLDLPGSNTTIFGNILYQVDIGVFFNSGRDNRVQNNIFIDCHPSVNIYLWPHKNYFQPAGPWKIVEKMHALDYQNPPYSVKYPKLPTYLDQDVGMPYGHEVSNNISCNGIFLDLSEEIDQSRLIVRNNLICDSLLLVLTKKWTQDYDPYHIGYAATYTKKDTAAVQQLESSGNRVTDRDPGFVDAANNDFRLKTDSPAWELGFQKIPMQKIGLYTDKYRHKN